MDFLQKVTALLKKPFVPVTESIRGNSTLLKQIHIHQINYEIRTKTPDCLTLSSYSTYSQTDEDDIIRKIFERIGSAEPLTFFEFGVEVIENNTLNIFLQNAKGCWYDKGLTAFKNQHGEKPSLKIFDEFITIENIADLANKGLQFLSISKSDLDLLSLDLDGNDYYFIEQMNKYGLKPKVYCLEYNAKFIPPMDIKIKYNPTHAWQGDDYFGCSLQSYVNLLRDDYTLLCCNITGNNCFFIRNDLKKHFTIYPVADLYQPARYYLIDKAYKGHAASIKFYLDK